VAYPIDLIAWTRVDH